jgi:hypothetical protein
MKAPLLPEPRTPEVAEEVVEDVMERNDATARRDGGGAR